MILPLLLLAAPASGLEWSGGVTASAQVDLPDGSRADETAGFGLWPAARGQLLLAPGPQGPALRLDLAFGGGGGWDRVALAGQDDALRQDARLAHGALVLGPQVWLPTEPDARVRLGAAAQGGLALVGVGQLASGEVEAALGGPGPHRTLQLRPQVDTALRAEVRVHPRVALVVEPGYSLCYTPPTSLGPEGSDPLAERRAFNLNLFRIGVGLRVLPDPVGAGSLP